MNAEVVVPVLTFVTAEGHPDMVSTGGYAERAATTWVDRFIVSGSTTRGDLLTVAERASLLDLWSAAAGPSRLLACTWCEQDVEEALMRRITPLAVLAARPGPAAFDFLRRLPAASYVYSHPLFGAATLDADLCIAARRAGCLPAGAKLAKASLADIAAVHAAAGTSLVLLDGSSRRVAASLAAGAAGVVATPLAALPEPFPERGLGALQRAIDAIQAALDALASREERRAALVDMARRGR